MRTLALLGLLGLAACRPDPTDAIRRDPPGTHLDAPAALHPLRVPSDGQALNAVLYLAEGSGPHPTVVLVHGFPGDERNIDLAQVLRRAGWNALVFHPRGAWGSEGDYRFAHVVEDVGAVLSWLRRPAVAAAHRVDPTRLALVGHSLGGFAALMAGAQDTGVRWIASLAGVNLAVVARAAADSEAALILSRDWQDALGPLQGTSGEALVQETLRHGEDWDLVRLAPRLANRHVLLVAGRLDQDIPPAQHHEPLARALAGGVLYTAVLEADHAFSQRRVGLAEVVLKWLPPAHATRRPHDLPTEDR